MPVSEFVPISRVFKFVNALIVSGIGPINLLKLRLKSTIGSKLTIEVGIDPARELFFKFNACRDVSRPMALGIIPLIRHVSKLKVDRTLKLPIEVGKEPFKATL